MESSQSIRIYRKKFPLGYLLHLFRDYYFEAAGYTDVSGCGRVFIVFYLLIAFRNAHRSYLKITPTGMELCWHPYKLLTIGWDEVLRLERKKWLGSFPDDRLYVDRPPLVYGGGQPIFLTESARKHFESQMFAIPLRQFQGWPDGKLAADLKQYIPDILTEVDAGESGS
ncbi:MAG: hypothetical protein JXB30_14210 [Anaerolineae bacterium]|nr:hypothetical protein [Anaerolineae bacterium]